MKFIFPLAPKPANSDLIKRIDSAAGRLAAKLQAIDLQRLPVSDYNKKYLRKYTAKLRPTFQKYAYILAWVLDGTGKSPDKTTILDYGGGSGLLSLLAKETGVGTVIYNDIFETSISDTKTLAQAFELSIDHYVCGDVGETTNFLVGRKMAVDGLMSCDVIEHIYDVQDFFRKVYALPGKNLSLVMSTHANPWNPAINHSLKSKQRLVELVDRQAEAGHKDRDALRSYINIRRDMIRQHGPNLSSAEVEILAKATRGKHEQDIKRIVASYNETKIVPFMPDHPTNTCDPNNGNCADRLTSPEIYKIMLQRSGFDARLRSGYYGHPYPFLRRILARLLDIGITLLHNQGIRLASYFLIIGKK